MKHPLFTFFIFAYLFFVLAILAIGGILHFVQVSPATMQFLVALASWTPNLAAVVVVFANREPGGIQKLIAGWQKWRVKPVWYLIALTPIAIAFISSGLSALSGGAPSAAGTGVTGPILLSMLVFNLIQGATGEELGWRGFALPKLQERNSPLVASIVLGLLISGWHSLLHLVAPIGVPEWQFWLVLVCFSVIVTWIYNRTGSLVIVTLFHFSFNFGLELVTTRLGLASLGPLFIFYVCFFSLMAAAVVLLSGSNTFTAKPSLVNNE